MSNPARASAGAAAGGAVNTPTESGTGLLSGVIGLSRLPKVISAPRNVSRSARNGYRDRKSTRLNSSHGYISYAVFCLKKKKIKLALITLGRARHQHRQL